MHTRTAGWTVVAAAALCSGAASGQVTVIASYLVQDYIPGNNNGPVAPMAPLSTVAGVSASDVTGGPGLMSLNPCGQTLDALGCAGQGSMESIFYSESFDDTDYFEWTITAAPGKQVNYVNMLIPIRARHIVDLKDPTEGRSSGPKFWELRFSTDGFATPGTTIGTYQPILFDDPGIPGFKIVFTEDGFIVASLGAVGTQRGSVTFRLYGYDIGTGHSELPLGMTGGIGNNRFTFRYDMRVIGEVQEGCYADCDASTGQDVLDFFDFICFQDTFASGDPYACDCDQSTGGGVCDFFDFVCFQDAFAAGCK